MDGVPSACLLFACTESWCSTFCEVGAGSPPPRDPKGGGAAVLRPQPGEGAGTTEGILRPEPAAGVGLRQEVPAGALRAGFCTDEGVPETPPKRPEGLARPLVPAGRLANDGGSSSEASITVAVRAGRITPEFSTAESRPSPPEYGESEHARSARTSSASRYSLRSAPARGRPKSLRRRITCFSPLSSPASERYSEYSFP